MLLRKVLLFAVKDKEQNNNMRYPAKVANSAKEIKDHYNDFAPKLKKSRAIWDPMAKGFGKDTVRRKLYEQIEKKLKWESKCC